MTDKPLYLAYLLRLWQVRREGHLLWRVSLESPHTGERWGFADIDQLLAFLRMKTEAEIIDAAQSDEDCEDDS